MKRSRQMYDFTLNVTMLSRNRSVSVQREVTMCNCAEQVFSTWPKFSVKFITGSLNKWMPSRDYVEALPDRNGTPWSYLTKKKLKLDVLERIVFYSVAESWDAQSLVRCLLSTSDN